jgi:calcineurin-like phosphoesterase family protein
VRFFTADLHLGHANIITYCARPFRSVEEMNDALIANWNATIGPDDEVWVLGDVAMGRIADTLPLVAELPGRKHLVPGNHDRCWPGGRRPVRPQDIQIYEEVGFEIHPPTVELTIADRAITACHLPVVGDSRDTDRFAEHRPHVPRDGWLLHGHVHEKWKIRDRQINVGVDVWDFRPVPEPEITLLIDSGPMAA